MHSYFQNVFPERKIYLPHEIQKLEINKLITDPENKIIFLTPEQGILIPNNSIDLSINTHSFQEMPPNSIRNYFDLIERVSENESLFFCANRVEKSQLTKTLLLNCNTHHPIDFMNIHGEEERPCLLMKYPEFIEFVWQIMLQ